ncbi:MAG: CsbD family protein [Pseudomonadota bacterium]|nr:CsbD family protein [Pseudomonadota bacterium]
MNWDQIEGNWKQFTGKAKEHWGELTNDEITEARGEREQLIGLVQSKYGKARDEAEREVDTWQRDLN